MSCSKLGQAAYFTLKALHDWSHFQQLLAVGIHRSATLKTTKTMLRVEMLTRLHLFSRSREKNFSTSKNQDKRPSDNRLSIDRCLLHCSRGPHTRRTDALPLSGRGMGQMFLMPGADDPSYATASAWQCKCGRFSLPLNRKHKRSLFTAALEQMSNVPSRVASFHTYSGSMTMSINTCTAPD